MFTVSEYTQVYKVKICQNLPKVSSTAKIIHVLMIIKRNVNTCKDRLRRRPSHYSACLANKRTWVWMPSTQVENLTMVAQSLLTVLRVQEGDRHISGAHWPASLVRLVCSKPMKDLVSKFRWAALYGMIAEVVLCPPYAHADTWTCMHMNIQKKLKEITA